MQSHIGRWGNSLALRIPGRVARDAAVTEGRPVEISVENGRIVVTPVDPSPEYSLERLLAGITKENLHGETDTGRAVGKETP